MGSSRSYFGYFPHFKGGGAKENVFLKDIERKKREKKIKINMLNNVAT